MKIGMILDHEFPPDPRVENEALTLVEAGHEVHLYCLKLGGRGRERFDHRGIRGYRYGVARALRSISALAYTLPVYHWLLRPSVANFVAESGVEVLHVHDMRSARAVFWVNRRHRLPLVLDLHENRPEIMKFYPHVQRPSGRLLIYPRWWKRWEHRFIRRADWVVVVTEAARAHYVAATGKPAERIIVVPNTVRRKFYTEYTEDAAIADRYRGDFVILYLGDTGLRRGLLTAIDAMPEILRSVPNARLVTVGTSRDEGTLTARARELGVAERVDQRGWQSFELFPAYIRASAIGICPLHRNLHHDTTYANKLFQSLAFGRPLVVSDSTAQRELVERYDCGLVFPERDAAAYARAVVRLATEAATYGRMAANARRAVEEDLHWEKYSRGLTDFYARLAAGHSPG